MSFSSNDNESENFNPAFSRRTIIKILGLGAAAASLPGCSSPLKKGLDDASIESISPIDRSIGSKGPKGFSGDNPDKSHRILWDKQAYLAQRGGLPAPTEITDVVVIGGGMSGLMSAYLLREHKPIVLERAPRFGGNAKGESWEGSDYSIGAAYFMEPDKGSKLEALLKELGVYDIARIKDGEDPVVWQGQRYYDFWEGKTAPSHAHQFHKLAQHFVNVCQNKKGLWFPSIPLTDMADKEKLKKLDRITFKKHLEEVVGEKLHPHIETTLEHFCWSSYGASFSEISAAAGLNFYAAEFGGQKIMVTQGGNSAIAECALKKLVKHLPKGNLRPDSFVMDVAVDSSGAVVTYEDAKGNLRAIRARAVVMACPKFVVSRILQDIEPKRADAIRQLRYNAYLVANVLLKGKVKDDFYDLFLIGEGKVNSADIAGSAQKQKVTDVVLGTYARPREDLSILTLYRALPYTGGRGYVYSDGIYDQLRAEFEQQINEELLALVGRKPQDVVDIRLSRWGHPLPVAEAGLYDKGVIDVIRAPFKERVFFVEQDNWMLPALETACGEALTWAPKINDLLKKS